MFDGRVDGGDGGGMAAHVGRGWKVIDREMRRVAKRRAALDAEEAKLLVEAKRAEIHKHLGYGSFAEYLERVCGYAPKTARDRIRVAEELENLPVMRAALADGVVCFSTVRELTRVATPHNETAWLSAVANCTVREVEDAVRGHAPGAMPYDRPDPDLEPRTLHLELPPRVRTLPPGAPRRRSDRRALHDGRRLHRRAIALRARAATCPARRRHIRASAARSIARRTRWRYPCGSGARSIARCTRCRGPCTGDVRRLVDAALPDRDHRVPVVRPSRAACGRHESSARAGAARTRSLRRDRARSRRRRTPTPREQHHPAAYPSRRPRPRQGPLHDPRLHILVFHRRPPHQMALSRRQPQAPEPHDPVRPPPRRDPRRPPRRHRHGRLPHDHPRRRPPVRRPSHCHGPARRTTFARHCSCAVRSTAVSHSVADRRPNS
jgi:hypothetical protein